MEKELTAKEVRALPVGTKVTVHGHDRYGYPTRLTCTIMEKLRGRKGVELRYFTYAGAERMPIHAHTGRRFTVDVSVE